MKKLVALLVVMVLITVIFPQTMMAASTCEHSWEILHLSSRVISNGASGHKVQEKICSWCKKCGDCTNTRWTTQPTIYKHEYRNEGQKESRGATKTSATTHTAYYAQKQKCLCGYERTVNYSVPYEEHKFVGGKCSKCGAKGPKVWDND